MEKIVRQTMLFDTYGELLTRHQAGVYGDVVYGDLSLSEAADTYGITRQGVHDLIKRCDRLLESYEERLGIIESRRKAAELSGRGLELLDELGGLLVLDGGESAGDDAEAPIIYTKTDTPDKKAPITDTKAPITDISDIMMEIREILTRLGGEDTSEAESE